MFKQRPVFTSSALITLLALAGCSSGSNSTPVSTTVTPVSITTTALPAGLTATAYSATILATNGTPPYTFSLASGALPAGLALSTAGVMSGTPSAAGSTTFVVQVADSSTPQGKATQNLTVAIATPLTLSNASLPSGTVGTPHSTTLQITGGTAPYTFAVTSGSLPVGLTISTNGIISGTPTATVAASFTVSVTDTTSQKASANYTVNIAPAPLTIVSTTLPGAQINSAYTTAIQITGGTAPYTATLATGTLPSGLSLSTTGVISGTATTLGTSTFTITVHDSAQQAASTTLTLTVNASPLVITTTTLPAAITGTPYAQTLTASGGTPPYAFSVTSGSLPAGLSLAANGNIAGIATTSGTSTITIRANDSSATTLTASTTLTLNVVNATVQVDTGTTLAIVPQTGFGMHASVYDSSLSDVTNLPALLSTSGITTLRYPGGLYSDNYHWAQYSLTPFFASTTPACGSAKNGYLAPKADFGSFVKTLQATGTQAIITVNYGTSLGDATGTKKTGTYGPNTCSEPNTSGQPQEAAAWVAYANGSPSSTQSIGIDAVGFDWKTVGFWASLRAASPLAVDDGYNFLRLGLTAPIGIKYWELGNELFYNGYNNNQNSETDLHAPYIYPTGYTGTYNSRTGVSAISPAAYGTGIVPFIQAMKAVDSIINLGVDLSSPGVDPIPTSWNPAVLNAVCTSANFDFAILHYYPGSYNNVSAAQLLSLPQKDMPALLSGIKTQLSQYCPAIASSVQFFITETGPNGTFATGTPTQIPGLYAAHEYLTSLETGVVNIDWLELHNGTYLTSGTEAPAPAYYGIQLAHLLAGVGDSLVSTTSSSKTVIAHATHKANGQKGILLLNADSVNAATIQVTVTGATLGATATQYSYGINTTQTTSALPSTTLTIPGNTFAITVPPYTATELLIP